MSRRIDARRFCCVAVASALIGLAGAIAQAQAPEPRPDATLVPRDDPPAADADGRPVQQGPITLERARELAVERFGGRVVRAETQTIDGREVHVIRIFDDRRVRIVRFDAQTGRMLR